MAHDVLDPGPNGDYPHFPRDAEGRPVWSDSVATDRTQVDGVTPMMRGVRIYARPDRSRYLVDTTPRHPDGTPIEPPVLLP